MTDQEVLISTLREARRIIGEYTGPRNANHRLIPSPIDQNRCAHWRNPMDMIFQGWSTSLFQA